MGTEDELIACHATALIPVQKRLSNLSFRVSPLSFFSILREIERERERDLIRKHELWALRENT